MRVNLNKIAEQIVPEYRYKQFVDSVADLDLCPLYKGNLVTFYPTTIRNRAVFSTNTFKSSKLRRYIFKYNSNGSFEFITTRRGQRNGGNNVSVENSQISVIITDPANNFAVLKSGNFNIVNENLFTAGPNVRIARVNGRFLWQEKPIRGFIFSTFYYSDATQNPLSIADKENDVNWYQEGTNKYVIANNDRVVYYNNNTLAGLNSWPIQNEDLGESRPEMLDDAYLSRCFHNVHLEAYDIVFVEVLWKVYTNRNTFGRSYDILPEKNRPQWLGESFTVPEEKGRVYRIGKLAASNGVGEYDIVTFAQRTRIKTTRSKRGGETVYN
jgi:hypothetical protein